MCGPTVARSTGESLRATDHEETVLLGICQSGYRHVPQECNGCVCPATRLRIRSDGHFFAHGMPDRSRVVSSACGAKRDGAARGGFGLLRDLGKEDRSLAETPVPLFESLSNGTGALSQ